MFPARYYTPRYYASRYFDEGGSFVAPAWNPFDKATGVVLTNGNLTATCNTNNPGNQNVRITLGRNTGKWVFEITQTVSHSAESTGFGFANATASLTAEYAGETNNSTGYYKDNGSNGEVFLNNAFVDSAGARVGSIPQTWMVACDLDNDRWWIEVGTAGFIKGGVTINITVANPVDSFSLTALGSGLLFPFLNLTWLDSYTINLGATAFNAPLPAGFMSWDGSQGGVTTVISTNRSTIAVIGKPTTVISTGPGAPDEQYTNYELPSVKEAKAAEKLKKARQALGIIAPDPLPIVPPTPLTPATGVMGIPFDNLFLAHRMAQAKQAMMASDDEDIEVLLL